MRCGEDAPVHGMQTRLTTVTRCASGVSVRFRFDEEVRDAARLLALIGPTPRPGGQMRMRKKRDELDRMLQGMVDRIAGADGDAPNHPLRHACAPDQILLRQFEDALGDQGRLRSWRLRREYNRRHHKTRDLMSVVLGRKRGSTRAPSKGGGSIGRLTRAAAGGARRGINALAESFSGRREGRAARTASSGELEA